MDGDLGLRAWRWLFIIEGVITIAVALAAFWVLPNFPRTTKWLSEEEVALAVWRLEEDIGQDDWVSSEDQSLWYGFKLAVADIKTWVLVSYLKFTPQGKELTISSSSCFSETYQPPPSPTSSLQ